MQVDATQNQNLERRQFNPLKAAAYGAFVGYVVKNELPVTEHEKQHYQYEDYMSKSQGGIKSTAKEELDNIRQIGEKAKKRNEGYDLFFKFNDPKATAKEKAEITKMLESKSQNIKATYEKLSKQLGERLAEAEKNVKFNFNSMVNRSRPTFSYVAIGAVIATAIGFVWHVLSRMSASSEPQ